MGTIRLKVLDWGMADGYVQLLNRCISNLQK
jgi:hypothetical protein